MYTLAILEVVYLELEDVYSSEREIKVPQQDMGARAWPHLFLALQAPHPPPRGGEGKPPLRLQGGGEGGSL